MLIHIIAYNVCWQDLVVVSSTSIGIGSKPVTINSYSNDTPAELNLVKEFAVKNGAFRAVLCDHWAKGGLGALELADAVIEACDSKSKFDFLYPLQLSIQEKIQIIAKEMYGAGQVEYTDEVLEKIKTFTDMVRQMFLSVLSLVPLR